MPIRFRTQDTRASTARKLNTLFALTGVAKFRAPTPTMETWRRKLNARVAAMVSGGYTFTGKPPRFRADDSRQMMTRKLNIVAAVYEAGV